MSARSPKIRGRGVEFFPRGGRLRKGYSRKQVNALVGLINDTLSSGFPHVSAGDIRRAGFELVRGGYDTAAVDAALDDLEEKVLVQATTMLGRTAGAHAVRELEVLRRQLSAPPSLRFARVRGLRRGHDIREVDQLIDRICASFVGGPGVSVSQLRSATFRLRRGGYDQDAVDHTLDRLIELLLVSRVIDITGGARPQSSTVAAVARRDTFNRRSPGRAT